MGFLEAFGAIPVATRVCLDRNRITGGGVTAGIDFGLYVASKLADEATAQRIQLYMEYAPQPPFEAGSPDTAPAAVVQSYQELASPMIERRRQSVKVAASRLDEAGQAMHG